MGYDATCQLPKAVRPAPLYECLGELNYKRLATHFGAADSVLRAFSWFEDKDYKSHRGVYVTVARGDQGLEVSLHTQISASYWDLEKINETIRTLRRRFTCNFRSDLGANRYFQLDGEAPTPAESGCALAFDHFEIAISRTDIYLSNRGFPDHFSEPLLADLLQTQNPWVLSNNLQLPYLVSVLEDYFKSTFVALLKYSERKEIFFKSARLNPQQLMRVSDEECTIEEAIAEALSFQNLRSVSEAFRTLIPDLDIHAELRRPYRRRRTSLWESVSQLIKYRHRFVHRGDVLLELDDNLLASSILDTQVAIDRVYRRLCEHFDWPEPYPKRYRRPEMKRGHAAERQPQPSAIQR